MIIKGVQKLTLLDFPGRVAATVFTPGCNLRCPFCHNGTLVLVEDEGHLTEAEVLEFLKSRKGRLDGVCVTGGEPLLQQDIGEFLRKIKDIGLEVKLDTNGFFPERLRELLDMGVLDYVAMDIKNSPEAYGTTCGIKGITIAPVLRSIELLKNSSVDYEFRTTVVRELHSAESIEGAARMIEGAPRYFLQNFVDSGDLIGDGLSAYSRDELQDLLKIAQRFVPNAEIRGV